MIVKLLNYLNLRGIGWRIAALVVASIFAIHLIFAASFLLHRPDQRGPPTDHGQVEMATLVRLIDAMPAAARPGLFTSLARAFPQLDIASLPSGSAYAANESSTFMPRGRIMSSAATTGFSRSPPTEIPTG